MNKTKKVNSDDKQSAKKAPNKDLPSSYYRGQNKQLKPQKDKNGDIIPM